jgi:signal transduction histidine kinase
MTSVETTSGGRTAFVPVSRTLRIIGLAVVAVAALAQLGRALMEDERASSAWYTSLGAAYLVIYAVIILRPPGRPWLLHTALAAECMLVLALLSLEPEIDFMTGLFVPLAFLAAFLLDGRMVWIWVTVLAVLTAGSLMLYLGPLRGLSLALGSMALEIVVAAIVLAAREIEAARQRSQTMLQELETTHRQLQEYAAQAGELATLDERERVARDLNDSVAQTVSRILTATRSAKDSLATVEAAPRLAALQAQTQQALAQMRSLIAELRPKNE